MLWEKKRRADNKKWFTGKDKQEEEIILFTLEEQKEEWALWKVICVDNSGKPQKAQIVKVEI